ncbi:serine hydrolase domain-containing protein [Natronogracilivirga saccharolytica]|uniref:Serine hydrolase n=1 Tax=Natronogracilivirga saccharolytica TaxID=2812953 RepID=A0A8J7RJM6_9BACT|nr:serine hydrolase [Natronogracilivirga saccharolytica]MBP3192015.1 serine hydrolase [Natronogracilivirga saccharolytica]
MIFRYSFLLMFPLLMIMTITNGTAQTGGLTEVPPQQAGIDPDQLARVDSLIYQAIDDGETPGAVLVVVRDSVVVHRKAYGYMQKEPESLPLSPETIYDLASLTKPLATATAAMKLVQDGYLRLSDPVADFVPEFEHFGGGSEGSGNRPRVLNLLTHTAGIPSYAPVEKLKELYGDQASDSLMTWLSSLPDRPEPGEQMTYSCPSYITLQKVIEDVTGMSLADYTRKKIFGPLGMHNTFYTPDPEFHHKIAPTSYSDEDGVVTGIVHDPLANEIMKGVSGNAGLFSTADDLALFAAMMLNDGAINGTRIFGPATVRAMTSTPDGMESFGRGPGWDLDSSFASNQGDLFGKHTYGHTGYTGTSMVMDADTRTAVILLTNRVYPDDSGSVIDLRAKVSNVVAASVLD